MLGLDSEELGKVKCASEVAPVPPPPPLSINKQRRKDANAASLTDSGWTGATPFSYLKLTEKSALTWAFDKKTDTGTIKFSGKKASFKVKLDEMPTSDIDVIREVSHVLEMDDFKGYACLKYLWYRETDRARNLKSVLPPVFAKLWETWSEIEDVSGKRKKEEADRDVQRIFDEVMAVVRRFELHLGDVKKKANKAKSCDDADEAGANDPPSATRGKRERAPKRVKLKSPSHYLSSPQYKERLAARSLLPISSYSEEILETVRKSQVTVIRGETGCGKSTQVPHSLLMGGRVGSVLVTQPRRVAAMSVCDRVCYEVGCSVGTVVGYSVRNDTKCADNTPLKFVTTGVALRMVQEGGLEDVGCVVVDEVHERQWQVDVFLVHLKRIMSLRPSFRVVLMSATIGDAEFSDFFGSHVPVINVPGRTFPVTSYYLEDVVEASGEGIDKDCWVKGYESGRNFNVRMRNGAGVSSNLTVSSSDGRSTIYDNGNASSYDGYSSYVKGSMSKVDESIINYNLIMSTILLYLRGSPAFTPTSPSGSILVFLPGSGEINRLVGMLESSYDIRRAHGDVSVLPLHSTLPAESQRKVFKGGRKIICSTNVAETSVTLPDVTCVIDTGLCREVSVCRRSNSSRIDVVWAGRDSCKQRSGRAGRVKPGVAIKMYSRSTRDAVMREKATPEINRMNLEEVVVSVLKCGIRSYSRNDTSNSTVSNFLRSCQTPPSESLVASAIDRLASVGCVSTPSRVSPYRRSSGGEHLTELGYQISSLGVDVVIGKMILISSRLGCVGSAVKLACVMDTGREPFAGRSRAVGDYDDYDDVSGIINAFDSFLSIYGNSRYGAVRKWCDDNGVVMETFVEAVRGRDRVSLCVRKLLEDAYSGGRFEDDPGIGREEVNALVGVAFGISHGEYGNVAKVDGKVLRRDNEVVSVSKFSRFGGGREGGKGKGDCAGVVDRRCGVGGGWVCYGRSMRSSGNRLTVSLVSVLHPLVVCLVRDKVRYDWVGMEVSFEGGERVAVGNGKGLACVKRFREHFRDKFNNTWEDGFNESDQQDFYNFRKLFIA